MTIELLISPAANGKTQACIEHIQAVKKANPLAPVWVIVPNQQAKTQFKERLASTGGSFGVRVGFFRTFYTEILEETGRFIPTLTPALSHRLVQETVHEASASCELQHYEVIKDKPGFLSVLVDAFAELRSALVEPEKFLDHPRDGSQAQRELAILYSRFLEQLGEIGWIDSEGQAWLAIEALASHPDLLKDMGLVVVDGFTAFTKAQIRFMRMLGEQAGTLLITLPGEYGSERIVYRRSQKVLDDLRAEFGSDSYSLTPLPLSKEEVVTNGAVRPGDLWSDRISGQENGTISNLVRHMAQNIFETGGWEQLDPPEPVMLETRSQAEEAREALRWVKRLHVRQQIPLEACALYCADLNTYQPLLQTAANEFGLNLHFSSREPLAESPAILAILNLFTLPLENFPTRNLLNALNSPFFDFGLDGADIEYLEKVAREAVIVGGKEQWEEAWTMLAAKSRTTDEGDEERGSSDLTKGIDLPALQARFKLFWQLFNQLPATRSQAGWIAWLENLLDRLNFYDNITTSRDRAACQSLGEALRALVISEKVMGTREIDYAQFLADLQGTLNGTRLEEDNAARRNAVFVSKLVEARAARYQAVALLGLSEGLFPVVENPDPFLDEQSRHDLKMESRLERDQKSTFYQAFTRADTHLLLTRPYLSEDGEKWEPSPYWRAAEMLFTENAKTDKQTFIKRPLSEAASRQEFLFWNVQQGQPHNFADEELNSRFQNLAKAGGILDVRRAKRTNSVYEGDLTSLASLLGQQYSQEHNWSASRLEAYSNCPFRFFTSGVLGLDITKPIELGLDIRQIGTLYHRILELVYAQAANQGTNPLEILDDVAEGVFTNAPRWLGFRPTALWEVEKSQHLEKLHNSLEAMESERGSWQPIAFEAKFGSNGSPSLVLERDGDLVRIHGIIDRVDRNPDGEVRVIDYKTGSSNIGNRDLVEGTRLQLPVYAKAAELALELGEVVDGFYWLINAGSPSSLTLTKFKSEQGEGFDAACRIAINHIHNNVNMVRRGNFRAKTPQKGCAVYCPASIYCWRYQARSNNG